MARLCLRVAPLTSQDLSLFLTSSLLSRVIFFLRQTYPTLSSEFPPSSAHTGMLSLLTCLAPFSTLPLLLFPSSLDARQTTLTCGTFLSHTHLCRLLILFLPRHRPFSLCSPYLLLVSSPIGIGALALRLCPRSNVLCLAVSLPCLI